jgi:acetyl-CoA synthetase
MLGGENMDSKNLAYLCLRESCGSGLGNSIAFKWVSNDLRQQNFIYSAIDQSSNKIANVLKNVGIKKGDVVSIFLPKSPELINCFFAILKNEAISCILFSTFGENALYDRLSDSRSKLIITKKSLLKRVVKVHLDLPDLKNILVIDLDEHQNDIVQSLPLLMAGEKDIFEFSINVDPEMPAFIQYTSGSTGKPKGALHVHSAYTAMRDSFREVFQLEQDESYWCTADPAWITGLVYGVIAPLAAQTPQIHFSGNFNAPSWLSILQNEKVNVWYTAPTALRMLMQEDPNLFEQYDYSKLDRIYSVGEPLNPEIYYWGKKVFGCEIYDNWFQSETGSIMIANRPGQSIKPGSMGTPLSYINAFILNEKMRPISNKKQGHLCLKKGWASMFRTYINKEDLYQAKFSGDSYITGDLAYIDEDGYFWYVSRSDDVINTAGHLVGPFEVESALLEIDEIIDVAVIGVPDPTLYEKIIAFLCLKKGYTWSPELELKCRLNISNKVSTMATPQEYHIVEQIPKNKSGKILRRVLKAKYEGKDPGDLSTMEES